MNKRQKEALKVRFGFVDAIKATCAEYAIEHGLDDVETEIALRGALIELEVF